MLTEEEYERLQSEFGSEELLRCIKYVDESAQSTGNKNKWKDWNLVLRKCHRERCGMGRQQVHHGERPIASGGAVQDLRELHELFGEE